MPPCITGLLKSIPTTRLGGLDPDRVLDRPIHNGGTRLAAWSTFRAGCVLHATLRRLGDARALSSHERLVWPYIAELRRALVSFGVHSIAVEQSLDRWAGLPGGTCDLLVKGGLAERGIIEVKVVQRLPAAPRPQGLAQAGGYLRLAARRESFERWWGAVAYIAVRDRRLRLFAYEDTRRLILSATAALKAA